MVSHHLNTVGELGGAGRRNSVHELYGPEPEARGSRADREETAGQRDAAERPRQIRRFLLLTKDLEADDAEMTATRKVRRRFGRESTLRSSTRFYSGAQRAELERAITYEDGRTPPSSLAARRGLGPEMTRAC